MSETRQKAESKGELTRYGKTLYESNPSVTGGRFPSRIVGAPMKRGGSAYMVAADTGEVVGRGAFGFVEETEVDTEQFVKVYLAGIKQYAQLTRPGALLFEFVYREISGSAGKDKDTVTLNFYLTQKWRPDIKRRTYERGVSELLEKEFLFRSVATDVYFVNVRFMFNGDRMVVVKAYRRKGSSLQLDMPLDSAKALPASSDDV